MNAVIRCMAVVALCALCSCAKPIYVPVESVKLDSVYFNKYERDSIYIKDSVFVYSSADTVFLNRWHNVYRDRIVCDTLYKSVCDTTTVVRTVQREFTPWESLSMSVGRAAIAILAFIVFYNLYILFRKLKK